MNKKPKFLVGLLSAVITFGILLATVGKPPMMKHHQSGKCHSPQTEQIQQK